DVVNAGHVRPGQSPGILTIDGNYTGAGTGALDVELNGRSAGTQYDRLTVNGTTDLGNSALNVTRGFTPALTDAFVIVSHDVVDPVRGTFGGLGEGDFVTADGRRFQISYGGGDGNDVVLNLIDFPPVVSTPIDDLAVRASVRRQAFDLYPVF